MKSTNQITEADYDFSEVKPEELLACSWYEYARESRAVRNEIAAIRKQKGKAHPQLKLSPAVQTVWKTQILMALSRHSRFPDTPWRKLPEIERKRFIVNAIANLPKHERYAETSDNPPLTFDMNAPGTTTLEMWKQKIQSRLRVRDAELVKYGFFAVNLKYGQPVLSEEFLGQLRHLEGKTILYEPDEALPIAKKTVKHPGRNNIRDTLNALGAMRLRHHCKNISEAQKKLSGLKNKEHGMFYGSPYSFKRACDFALNQFQNRYGWLDPAKPIHFQKAGAAGAQKLV